MLKKAPENIRLSDELRGTREQLLQVAQEFDLEGLVAKKRESVYESGRRGGAWVKFKIAKAQEFVIGGYTPPEGSRKYFGSLIVGYRSPEGLRFAGRVGTGFSEKLLAELYAGMQKLKQTTCPFVNLLEKKPWAMGPKSHSCNHETLFLGRTSIGRPGQVYGVDARRPASSACVPRAADR